MSEWDEWLGRVGGWGGLAPEAGQAAQAQDPVAAMLKMFQDTGAERYLSGDLKRTLLANAARLYQGQQGQAAAGGGTPGGAGWRMFQGGSMEPLLRALGAGNLGSTLAGYGKSIVDKFNSGGDFNFREYWSTPETARLLALLNTSNLYGPYGSFLRDKTGQEVTKFLGAALPGERAAGGYSDLYKWILDYLKMGSNVPDSRTPAGIALQRMNWATPE